MLSPTNQYVITVTPVTQPRLSAFGMGNDVRLVTTGMIGPDYSLLTSTNLQDWLLLVTTNPTLMPFTLTDTNQNDPQRFYRVELGP